MAQYMTSNGLVRVTASGRKNPRHTKKRLQEAQNADPLRQKALARANEVRRQHADEREALHR